MDKMLFLTLFFLCQFYNGFVKGLPKTSTMSKVFEHHTNGVGILHMYFCRESDAVIIMRNLLNSPTLFNINSLDTDTDKTSEIRLHFHIPTRHGIFLDLTCNNGRHLLVKNSSKFNGSYAWLLWASDHNQTIQTLLKSRVAADSKITLAIPSYSGAVKLLDIFRMSTTLPFIITEVALWNEGGVYTRLLNPPGRGNFQGAIIPASLLVKDMEPYVINGDLTLYKNSSFIPVLDVYQRYCLSLLIMVATSLNITFSYVQTESWGYPLKNGSWNGVIGQLVAGETEVGLAAVTYTKARMDVIDFLLHLHELKTHFTFKQPSVFGSPSSLLRPLTPSVWASLLVIVIVGVAVIKIKNNFNKTTNNTTQSYGDSIFLLSAALSQQGIPENAESLSMKIIHFFILFSTYFTSVFYNTALLYFLILPSPKAIQNIQQLLASDLRLGIQQSPYFKFEMTWNDSLSLRLRKKLEKTPDPFYTIEQGALKIKEGHFAYYHVSYYLDFQKSNFFSEAEICSLTDVAKYRPNVLGGMIAKNSPFREPFNKKLMLLAELGIKGRLFKKWLEKKSECNWQLDAVAIGFEPVVLSYCIMCAGIATSVIIFLLELFRSKHL